MRKEYWKKVSLLLVAAILLFSGCGTSEEKKSPYEGKWIGLVAETMGVQMSVEEAIGGAFEFEVKKNNKVLRLAERAADRLQEFRRKYPEKAKRKRSVT